MNIKLTTTLLLAIGFSALTVNAQKGFTSRKDAKNEMKKNLKDGNWVEYMDATGKPTADTAAPYYMLSVYKKGKKNGVCNSYAKGAKLESAIPYKDDKINGTATYYYASGKMSGTTTYTNDVINGAQKTYYEDGKVKSEATWVNGKSTTRKDYDETGKEVK
jgi:antitoxin component YwqK of YwqJK toxin-antitoxin module